MNCQSTIMIDDFTLKNGATMVGPGSQLRGYFPKEDEFWPIMKQTTGRCRFSNVNDRFACGMEQEIIELTNQELEYLDSIFLNLLNPWKINWQAWI